MSKQLAKISEYEIVIIAMMIAVNRPRGVVTFEDLKIELPRLVILSEYDKKTSPHRKEPRWLQRARNIKSHESHEKNFIYKDYLSHVEETGLQITQKGRNYIKKLMRNFVQFTVKSQS